MNILVSAEELSQALAQPDHNLLVVDLSSETNYRAGHIPGALYLHPSTLQCGRPPAPGKMPAVSRLEDLFTSLGIGPDTHVVACDDEGGGWAARLLWTLAVLGHHKFSFLNGGIHAWRGAGLIQESNIAKPNPVRFHANPDYRWLAEVEDILPQLGSTDLALWDARSPAEHSGEKIVAARGGHIPGAINLDWLELFDPADDYKLMDLESLRAKLAALGLGDDKAVITYCQTHHRSSLSWLVMLLLDYPEPRGYHGSWGEWASRPELPVEV